MNVLRLLPCLAVPVLAIPAVAQKVDLAEAQAALDHVFERPPGRIDRAVVQERFVVFWKTYDGKDLGRLSYARGLTHFWNGDLVKAADEFDKYIAKHGSRGITNREQRMTIGRSFLSTAVRLSREAKVDEKRFVAAATNFARCYDDIQGVASIVTRYLGADQGEVKARARVAMAKVILAKALSVTETDGILAAIYKDAPARRVGGVRVQPAGRAARQRGPTTIEPFTATAMSGREIDLKSYRGQVVLVDFWATWCGPCLREMPHVVEAYKKYRKSGFDVIGISLDKRDAEAKISAKATELGMKWEQIYDGGFWDARIAKANGIRSIPAAFLIDRTGKVRFSGRDTRGANLAKNIELLLAEKGR